MMLLLLTAVAAVAAVAVLVADQLPQLQIQDQINLLINSVLGGGSVVTVCGLVQLVRKKAEIVLKYVQDARTEIESLTKYIVTSDAQMKKLQLDFAELTKLNNELKETIVLLHEEIKKYLSPLTGLSPSSPSKKSTGSH